MSSHLRFKYQELGSDDFSREEDGVSTIGGRSSPPDPRLLDRNIPSNAILEDWPSDDSDDGDYGANARAAKLSNIQKTQEVLSAIRKLNRYSLRIFLEEIFTSEDSTITNFTQTYLGQNGYTHLLDLIYTDKTCHDPTLTGWIISKAGEICAKEATCLTDTARKGPFYAEALALRLPSQSVTVEHLKSFSVRGLLQVYERVTPNLQTLLKAVIQKQNPDSDLERQQRNPDMGRTMITSMLLNLRSRETNLHQAMNCLLFWDGKVPKRVVQTFNHYGICTSYNYQTKAVPTISKDATRLASRVANDLSKMCLLPYDNFNWVEKAWETSATHGNAVHDQVSALLVVLDLPPGSDSTDAARLSDPFTFEQTKGTRHHLEPDISLEQILPHADDQNCFFHHSTIHVSHILAEEVGTLSGYRNVLGPFHETHELPAKKTEEYFLPTFDQEQTSTRGNMIVLDHFFRDVLKVPNEVFENKNYFVLGDRLTTARDRAAQDQRALDRSEHRFDHLASISILSGLMHVSMNQVQNMGRNTWGTAGARDALSLATLLSKLPNSPNLNLKKLDFYAWLRFFDVILRALVMRAAMVILDIASLEQFRTTRMTEASFRSLCSEVASRYIIPSVDRLEAEGTKSLLGSTECGNAVLLMHDLMTMREMRDAIKFGHPDRVERMLKYWTPIFYAGGSYNYANELMELLHNLVHDWPPETAQILRAGMFMNNQGKRRTFKETDIRVEQFNKSIKSHAHGSNARPGLLEKITPAIGHIQELTEKMFDELGVFDADQRHTDVKQHEDVILLLEHFCKADVLDFSKDKASSHLVVDLFQTGLHRLSGPKGGHAKHLRRHDLRSRQRHDNEMPPGYYENLTGSDMQQLGLDNLDEEFDKELEQDNIRPQLSLIEQLDAIISDSLNEYE
ncbi:hypothetical protein R3P38DRAFT_3595082 [Favolaschia claudopus]|uniref:DUF6589 domain-containing protein n=1 Tax=Favolaschia claudopus TaxID=2862362 RepID=A0AAW0DI55_9AGAR